MLQKFFRFLNNPQKNNQRILRHMEKLVAQINAQEPKMRALSDEDLAHKTEEFKALLADGKTLDDILVPAFAVVREAAQRVLGMRPFDVQLCGGIALHQGMIAEMKTGEGKTLVGTLPVYLNALMGKGVHVITVNDYLAQRDSSVMRPLYEFLGLSVGCIIQDLSHGQRHQAYHADITYGTNNEFGFDYLKDNMKFNPSEMCQRGFSYAIVDEVDSILIDEARTPLIISGPAEDASHLYDVVNEVILGLQPEHYEVDEKNKNVSFTDSGYIEVEKRCKEAGLVSGTDLFQPANLMLVHHLNQSLKAQKNFHKDIDYIVKDGKVVLIDEFTGRMMKGRRYSDGLHQALEAKEHVEIEVENQTLASITFQNFFRMYDKLAGMTGTAETEAAEFHDIYKLPVVSIPTNVPVARKDLDDEIFRTFDKKLHAVLDQIKACHDRQQPVLVGTLSVEKSEIFSEALKKLSLPFHVLNARHHEQEAKIIGKAGSPGAITIATNMAGRGTDIKLGGNLEWMLEDALRGIEDEEERAAVSEKIRATHRQQEEIVRKAGGLFVLGTERNENRRIDNQLRGRSGRQGDPGCSKFFISLDDDLMRIFGPNLKMLDYSLRKIEESEGERIENPWYTRAIARSQQKVEAQHFDTRKHLLKYADVLNAQRTAVYDERHALMHAEHVHDRYQEMTEAVISEMVAAAFPKKNQENGNWMVLTEHIQEVFDIAWDYQSQSLESVPVEAVEQAIVQAVHEKQVELEQSWGQEMRIRMEKSLMLKTLDQVWIAHLNAIDHLRSGIHLQAYGQKDPLNEYRHEAFVMFKGMKTQWYRSFLTLYFHANPMHLGAYEEEDDGMDALLKKWSYQHESLDGSDTESDHESSEQEDVDQVDYQKILEKLMAQDRTQDGDGGGFEYLWNRSDASEKTGLSKKTRSSGAGSSRKPDAARSRSGASRTARGKPGAVKSVSTRSGITKETLDERAVNRLDRVTKADSKGGLARSGGASGKARNMGGQDIGTTRATSGKHSGALKKSASTGYGGSDLKSASNRGAPLGTTLHRLGKSPMGVASSQDRALSQPMKRRAASKRGPYIPKNVQQPRPEEGYTTREIDRSGYGESEPVRTQRLASSRTNEEQRAPRRRTAVGRGPAYLGIPKDLGERDVGAFRGRSGGNSGRQGFGLEKDPKTRWKDAGSGSQRPGRSASTRPAVDTWKVKEKSRPSDQGGALKGRGLDQNGRRSNRQKTAPSESLVEKFYTSRMTGGGRALARSGRNAERKSLVSAPSVRGSSARDRGSAPKSGAVRSASAPKKQKKP